jgi:hypothetical protein
MFKNGRIWPNTVVRLSIRFTDEDGDLTDPTTIKFKSYDPCGEEVTYTYGTDDELQKESTGKYTMDLTPDKAGRWRYRWETTGETLVREDSFIVQASPFVDDCWPCSDYSSWWH